MGLEGSISGRNKLQSKRSTSTAHASACGMVTVGQGPVEEVVDVLEEGLLFDLRVGEEEDAMLFGLSGAPHDLLDVLAPVVQRVGATQLDLEQLVVGHVCRQTSDRLTPGAADADEQRVTSWLLQHPRHSRDVLDGEPEQHEVHRLLADLVVLVEVCLYQLQQQSPALDTSFNSRYIWPVSEHSISGSGHVTYTQNMT